MAKKPHAGYPPDFPSAIAARCQTRGVNMLRHRLKLFTLFGFEVRIDLSWLVIVTLVVWSLAVGAFPHYYPGLSKADYWTMGIIGALTLFASIVAHEFAHSLVARRHGLPMKSITLFLFGGVAEMEEHPKSAGTEFSMAIAGPLTSLVLGFIMIGLRALGSRAGWAVEVTGVLGYLGVINILLAGFNLIPAFPLDGGRVFRAALWRWRGDVRWSTRVASGVGSVFGWLLVALGLINVIRGNLIGGVWLALIGLFLRTAAQRSYEEMLLRRALESEEVGRFMTTDPVAIPAETSLEKVVNEYIYTQRSRSLPVVSDGELIGCLGPSEIRHVPRDQWSSRTAREVVGSCEGQTIAADTSAMAALDKMRSEQTGQLYVVAGDRLIGTVAFGELIRFAAVKTSLEGGGSPREDEEDSAKLRRSA